MRTKHLLYTMALASIFAACTQDEFETVNGADALAGRKSIGKVTFTEAPSTRWDVDNFNTINPEAGDGYSLLLVDVPRHGLDGQHVYPIDNYELVNEVQTNYVFKTDDGANFSNDAELVEGNYLFVAPAQEGKLDRKTVEITLPTEQNLSLGADGKLDPLSAIKEFAESGYPFYIGHRFLSEGGEVSTPAMRNIFAFPEITVKNTDVRRDQKAILKQVILKRTNGKSFTINATVDTRKAATVLTNEWFEAAGEDTKGQLVVGGWAGHMSKTFGETIPEGENELIKQDWKEDGTPVEIPENVNYEVTYLNGDNAKYYAYDNGLFGDKLEIGWTSDLLGTPESTSSYIVINMPGEGIELGYNETITFNAIIPAERYVMGTNKNDLEIYAVLQNDEAWKKIVDSNTNVDMRPGKRYPAQDYTGLEVKDNKGRYFTIDINEEATDGLGGYEQVSAASILGGVTTVKTTADLVAAIKANSSTEVLNITIEGRNVVYNNEVNNAVARTTCQNVTIQGYIKVEGSDDAEKPLIIDPRVTIEQVVIEKGNVQAGATNLKSVFIAKDGALNLTKVLVNGAEAGNAVIDNAGTLTLSTTKFAEVNNYSKLNVNAKLGTKELVANINNLYAACGEGGEIISPSIDLEPKVEVMADAAYAIYDIEEKLDYEITVDAGTKADNSDAGQLVLIANTNIVKNIQWFNNKKVEKVGNIINNGKIIGDHSLTVDAGRTMTVGTKATVEGKVIISAATEKLANMTLGIAEYEPAAVVYNAGTLKDVEVNGLLKMMNANAHVDGKVSNTATENSDKGEIDNSVKGVIAEEMTEENVVVFATIDKIDLDDHENTVKALKDYTTRTRQVTVFRLIGEMKRVQSMENGEAVKLTNAHVGEAVKAIEFMAGSSITLGEVTVESEIDFIARAKNILVNGRTADISKLSATKDEGYRYLGFDENTRKYYSEQGSFKANNSTIE